MAGHLRAESTNAIFCLYETLDSRSCSSILLRHRGPRLANADGTHDIEEFGRVRFRSRFLVKGNSSVASS